MYIYFDKNRVIREIINDEATVKATGSKTIYSYFEECENNPYPATILFKLPDGTVLPENNLPLSGANVTEDIPYNKNRDLKFFKYGKDYNFVKWVITDELINVFSQTGTIGATITYILNKSINMELFTFEVEDSVIKTSEMIDVSQWNYLVQLFKNKNVFVVSVVPDDLKFKTILGPLSVLI